MHEHRARIADLRLRGNTRPLPVRVYWPGPGQPTARRAPLLVFCVVGVAGADAEAISRALSSGTGLVVLSVSCDSVSSDTAGPRDGTTVLEWAAEHAAELGADPRRLLVAGEGEGAAVAAVVALGAGERGWPVITRQVLINPVPTAWPPAAGMGAGVAAGVAAAIVVTLPDGGGERCSAWLREAGVAVAELRCAVADLGQALRRSLTDESARSATSSQRPR